MDIVNTASRSGTKTLHDDDIMPEGYSIDFEADDTAVVRSEVGEAAIEKYRYIEAVEDDSASSDAASPGDDDSATDGQASEQTDSGNAGE